MKIFLDTANLDEIKIANDFGILDGVTTNPSLMAKEGIVGAQAIYKHYLEIATLVHGDVSAEVLSNDYESMVNEAKELSAIHNNIVVKIPCTEDGLKAIHSLKMQKIRTNCTLIFNATQALFAARSGATYVSPFIGRLDDIGTDGIEEVAKIVDSFYLYKIPSLVLAASIRSVLHVTQCMEIGVDVVTCPFKIFNNLYKHPLTDKGLTIFMQDATKLK